MKTVLAVVMSLAVVGAYTPLADAQTASCPDVARAKDMLQKKTASARGQDAQAPRAPRSLAGARGQDAQAPRGQDAQAPRGQDAQAPRGQDAQAPRGQDAQAPRGQDAQAPRGQDAQAPRGQDAQAPRGQDAQAPRGQDAQAPRSLAGAKAAGGNLTKASTLIKEAEAACKAGDTKTAKTKADAAMAELK